MSKVSILIPSRGERFLQHTITDLLTKATGQIEIIAVLDGYWPDPQLKEDPRVIILHKGKSEGMREGINGAARISTGKYLMKLDAHCMVDTGYDEILQKDIENDWVVIPRRVSLDAENWTIKKTGKAPVDIHFLSYPFEKGRPGAGMHGQVWVERAKLQLDQPLTDEMSSQGSCWFTSRKHWERLLNPLQVTGYGTFVQEFQEIGNKTWLRGGRVVCNKKTWYAHLHKGKEYGRGYFISKHEMSRGSAYCVDYWMNDRWAERKRDLRWLIEKFWPVPSWPTLPDGSLDWDTVQKDTADFTERYRNGQIALV